MNYFIILFLILVMNVVFCSLYTYEVYNTLQNCNVVRFGTKDYEVIEFYNLNNCINKTVSEMFYCFAKLQ